MAKFLLILLTITVLVSCKKEIVVFDNDPDTQFELPLILKLNDKNCFYDAGNNLLKYSLDQVSLNNFSPVVQFQDFSTVVFEGKQLQNNEPNELGNIELHKVYSLEITTEGQTKKMKLVFTDIPMIQVVTFDKIPNEPKALARMTVNYPEKGSASQVDWIGIEQRGASSLSYDKKSYGLTVYANKNTSNPVSRSYFNFSQNEDWILDAMYVDGSRLRNKTSFELWASLGEYTQHDAIHSRFVEVFLNNESVGLYNFSENFTKELLKLNSSSVYYRGNDNSDVTFFQRLASDKPNAGTWGEWEQKYPKPSKQINWTDFNALSNLIVKSSDAEFKNKIGQQIDLDNVIDYYLFINLCGGFDNVGKNWGFLKRNPSDKFTILPWDLDATWGRTAFGAESNGASLVTNGFFQRLESVNPDNFNQRVKQRWKVLRDNQFSRSNLMTLFQSNMHQLLDYKIIQQENSLWNLSLNLQLEESFIEIWILARLDALDSQFE